MVRERLERKVKKLTARLDALVSESRRRACPKDCFDTMLADMKTKVRIHSLIIFAGFLFVGPDFEDDINEVCTRN